MYVGVIQNKGYVVHNYAVTGDTIAEVVENMRTYFINLDIIDEFEEDNITFYSTKELIVQKRVEYVIIYTAQ